MAYCIPVRSLAYGLLALALGLASQAQAVDGVIEINQASAIKGGVVPGDAPGFPITIFTGALNDQPASFRLTGPLFTSTTTNMIEIGSPHVTLDLNGFMVNCLIPTCSGKGILSTEDDVAVANGTVRGFSQGVSLTGLNARVENVRAPNNATGLALGNNCLILNSIVTSSGGIGITTGNGCTISGNTSSNNSIGFLTANDCLVHNNIASGNTGEGIKVAFGCTVSGNTSNNNGSDGICTLAGTNVIGNTARSNVGYGLNLSSAVGYSGNVISNNTAGTVVNGTNAGNNVCNGILNCP